MKFWHSQSYPYPWTQMDLVPFGEKLLLLKISVLPLTRFLHLFPTQNYTAGLVIPWGRSPMMRILDQHNKSWRNIQDCFTMLLEHQMMSWDFKQQISITCQHQGDDDRVSTQMTSACTFDSWCLWFLCSQKLCPEFFHYDAHIAFSFNVFLSVIASCKELNVSCWVLGEKNCSYF